MPRKPRTPILPVEEAAPSVVPELPSLHDRTLTGEREHLRPFRAALTSIEVDDPMARKPGDKLLVSASLRDDPLLRFRARDQISADQYEAGRAMQELFDAVEISNLKAIDTTREAVDGGRMAEMLSLKRMSAADWLKELHTKLGVEGYSLCRAVLAERKFLIQIVVERGQVDARGKPQARAVNYLFRRLKECLDTLSVELGFAMAVR